jgi:hypothetical protein
VFCRPDDVAVDYFFLACDEAGRPRRNAHGASVGLAAELIAELVLYRRVTIDRDGVLRAHATQLDARHGFDEHSLRLYSLMVAEPQPLIGGAVATLPGTTGLPAGRSTAGGKPARPGPDEVAPVR